MSRKEMIQIDFERLNAVFTAYGTTPVNAATKIGLGNGYFSNAKKRGSVSVTTIAALKSVGIDITPAIVKNEPAEEPAEEATGADRITAAIDRLTAVLQEINSKL